MKFVATALKAFYGAASAALTGLAAVLVGGTTISHVSDGQWVTIAIFALGAFGAVYGVSNADKKAAASAASPAKG